MVLFGLLFSIYLNADVRLDQRKIDPALRGFVQGQEGESVKRVLAILNTQDENPDNYPNKYQKAQVIRFLKERHFNAINDARACVRARANGPSNVRNVQTYWINNTFTAEVTPTSLAYLAECPQIKKIYLNRRITFDRPLSKSLTDGTDGRSGGTALQRVPYDFKELGLDRLIQERPSLTGRGVILGSLDSGVDSRHPALSGKVLLFYDGQSNRRSQIGIDIDPEAHGTHTAGTMVGGNRTNMKIGVAPDAKLIAAGSINDYDSILRGMEFFLDPDGNPDTNDTPRVINNSWNCDGAPDLELFYKAIAAWEVAGVLPVFSSGNSGPGIRTITKPHEYPNVLTVGSTGRSGIISEFSSRGPAVYRGKEYPKPDLTAPGEQILSSVRVVDGKAGFALMSGTSMSTPHVSGGIALLLQENPNLNPAQIRDVLIRTAMPMTMNNERSDQPQWNPVYGAGKASLYNAVQLVSKVKIHSESFIDGALPDLENLLLMTSPEKIIIDSLLSLGEPEKLKSGSFDYPTELKGDEWLSLEEISASK